jgi:hypothetical protein
LTSAGKLLKDILCKLQEREREKKKERKKDQSKKVSRI